MYLKKQKYSPSTSANTYKNATAQMQPRHPCHMANGFEVEPYSSMSRGNDEVTDKGTQRERHKVFYSIWDEFYGDVD